MAGWFLQFQGSRFGPLSVAEVKVILGSGKLTGQLFGWKHGMREWEMVERIPEIAPFLAVKPRDESIDNRSARRVKFMAAVRFASAGSNQALATYTGICRDLSKGGMQVVSSANPGYPGNLVSLTIEPVSDPDLPVVELQGVIVRLLVNNTGFSIRFSELTAEQERGLSACLKASGGKTKTGTRSGIKRKRA